MASNIIRIDSLEDRRVAEYRTLTNPGASRAAGFFIAEGRLVVARLLENHRFRVRSVLSTPAAMGALRPMRDDVPMFVADQQVMDGIVGFNIHRGCVAIAERPVTPALTELPLAALSRVLVLEGVGNPDNIGGLFRSAAAFGVEAVILGPRCADPFYRKAIRTSMAATLHVPFANAGTWPAALESMRRAGLTIFALTPDAGATVLDDTILVSGRYALLVGSEGPGLTAAAMAAADCRLRIATSGHVDSLNVTVAASIALHYFSASDRSRPSQHWRLTPDA